MNKQKKDGTKKKITFDKIEEDKNEEEYYDTIDINKFLPEFFFINKDILDIIKNIKYKDNILFSPEKIKILSEVKYNNNILFDNNHLDFIYEFINYYIDNLENNFFENGKGDFFDILVEEIKSIKTDDVYFGLPIFKEVDEMIRYKNDLRLRKNEYTGGIYICRNIKCKSEETTSRRMQTRSSDEGESIIVTCNRCNATFTVS